MHKGSCLCGSVTYEISGELGPVLFCHCTRCRKANGSAFTAVVPVPSASFNIVKGAEFLRTYQTETGVQRIFCSNCGSPIIGKRESAPETVRVRIGTLDTPLETKATGHIFVGSKAEWYDIDDHMPQYHERP
ncbi:MAG: GFA family protein [Pseudomonadota bacterium]